MALTPSQMVALGSLASTFTLPDVVSGKYLSLSDIQSPKATVIMFICNHCPYVVHINGELVRLANDYMPQGISFVAVSANDASAYPDDAPDKMKIVAEKLGYPFPYLYDESQVVARAYDAACTPDFFVYDKNLQLVYRGQLDSSRPNSPQPPDGSDMRAALDTLLTGGTPSGNQRPSMGCNIKWKKV